MTGLTSEGQMPAPDVLSMQRTTSGSSEAFSCQRWAAGGRGVAIDETRAGGADRGGDRARGGEPCDGEVRPFLKRAGATGAQSEHPVPLWGSRRTVRSQESSFVNSPWARSGPSHRVCPDSSSAPKLKPFFISSAISISILPVGCGLDMQSRIASIRY